MKRKLDKIMMKGGADTALDGERGPVLVTII